MRLTLRTLLAYLDDTLDAEQAKAIGQKVAESEVAQELIERIKRVTRRRSLASPPVLGEASRLDANTVAEYLEGKLDADQLAEVEQTCLDDDVYLAEVASSHQILTLMLSDPARVPPTARKRIYKLVTGPESNPNRRPPAFASDSSRSDRAAAAVSASSSRWPLYIAAILFLTAGLAASVWLAWPRSPVSRSMAPADPLLAGLGGNASPTSKEPPKNDDAKKAPPPAQKMPEPIPPAAKPETELTKTPIDRLPVTAPSVERQEIGTFATAGSVLLESAQAERDGWRLIAPNGRVQSGSRWLSLPGYRNEVKLDGGVLVNLWGNLLEFPPVPLPVLEASVIAHLPGSALDADLTLERGRLVLTNTKSGAALRVRLRFRTEIWDLTLAAQAQIVADAQVSYPPGVRFSKDGGEGPLAELFLGVVKGKVTLQIGDQEPIELAEPPNKALIGWDNKTRLKPTVALIGQLPSWTFTLPKLTPKEPAAEYKAVLDQLQKRLSQPGTAVAAALLELAGDAKPFAQAYASYALAATDNVGPLVDALDELLKPDMRTTAILALRHWVARDRAHAGSLHQLLMSKKNFSDVQADAFLMLMHNFSAEDLANTRTYENLFNLLNDDRLAVRLLTLWHMGQYDPDGLKSSNFNPIQDADKRSTAIERWRKRITDGKLPPKPMKNGKPNS